LFDSEPESESGKPAKHPLSSEDYNYQTDLAAPLSWKVISTAISFVVFGLGGLLLSMTVFPLIYLAPIAQQRRQKISRKLLSKLFRAYIRMMEAFGLIKLTVIGAEHLKSEDQLVIANHPSLLDVVYLISLIDNATSLVKGAMWINPFTAGTVLATHYIRNDGDNPLQGCVDALENGESLIIFPEGTRSDPQRPFKFHRGAANIALQANKDISPVTISSSPPRLLKHQPWYEASKQTLQITLHCHPNLPIAPYLAMDAPRSKVARQLTRDLQALYSEP
jgi:1-acyl-sn-glycerol-3-phosphate acyltransferase